MTATETTVSLEKVMGPDLLRTPEQEITVPNFKFISRLTLFTPWSVCSKRLSDLSSSSTKCQQCGTRQRTSHLTRASSVRICVVHNKADLWLSALTKDITKLLEAKSLTLNNTVEDIKEAMMNVQNITFKYDSQKNVITDIVSAKDLSFTPFMRQITKLLQLNHCRDIKLWKIFKNKNIRNLTNLSNITAKNVITDTVLAN